MPALVIPRSPWHDKGRGRKRALDARDHDYTMRRVLAAILPTAVVRPPWHTFGALDQGSEGACVGFGWTHFLQAAPYMHALDAVFAMSLYYKAREADEWPGTDYDGTSVRAGAAVLTAMGVISGYVWAWDSITVRDFVLTRGPVVMGTDWLEKMFEPNPRGYLEPEGGSAGGHCWTVLGYSDAADRVDSLGRGSFRMQNSWGNDWGENGRAWLSWDAMLTLLDHGGGEACSAIEVRAVPR